MYFQWKPYVSVAERRRKAERAAVRYQKKTGQTLSPVTAAPGAIAKTFWGKAWCDNLERYSDYSNRLPRGRTYVRNGSVIDLRIAAGEVSAQVMGSDLYQIKVNIAAVPKTQWNTLGGDCAGSIDSLVELLQGRLSKGVMSASAGRKRVVSSPKEIKFNCSRPDWATMCKHRRRGAPTASARAWMSSRNCVTCAKSMRRTSSPGRVPACRSRSKRLRPGKCETHRNSAKYLAAGWRTRSCPIRAPRRPPRRRRLPRRRKLP